MALSICIDQRKKSPKAKIGLCPSYSITCDMIDAIAKEGINSNQAK